MKSIATAMRTLIQNLESGAPIQADNAAAALIETRKSSDLNFNLSVDHISRLLGCFTGGEAEGLVRRWLGMLLLQVFQQDATAAKNTHTSLSDALPSIAELLEVEEHNDVRFVAGRIMQTLLQQGASEDQFWKDGHTGFEADTFPTADSSQWTVEFDRFCHENVGQHFNVPWPTHIEIETRLKLARQSGGMFIVFSELYLTVVDGTSAAKFIDIPLHACTSSQLVEAAVRDSPSRHKPTIAEIVLKLSPPAVTIDSEDVTAAWVKIGFLSVNEARLVLKTIHNKRNPETDSKLGERQFAASSQLPVKDTSADKRPDEWMNHAELFRASPKRPFDDDSPSDRGRLKPTSQKKPHQIERTRPADDRKNTFRVPASPKGSKRPQRSAAKSAQKKIQSAKSKPTVSRKKGKEHFEESEESDEDPLQAVDASNNSSRATKGFEDSDSHSDLLSTQGPRAIAKVDPSIRKPQIVAFSENGPVNQPNVQRLDKRRSDWGTREQRIDSEGFAIPSGPRLPARTSVRAVVPTGSKAFLGLSEEPLGVHAHNGLGADKDAPTSTRGRVESKATSGSQHRARSPIPPMSAMSIFSTPTNIKKERARAGRLDETTDVQDGSHIAPINVSDNSIAESSGSSDSKIMDRGDRGSEGRAADTTQTHLVAAVGLPGARNMFGNDELVEERPASSPAQDARTGSQLSRRVSNSGSPFPAQIQLPLGDKSIDPLVQQLRAPRALHMKVAEEQEPEEHWSEADETLVEDADDHQALQPQRQPHRHVHSAALRSEAVPLPVLGKKDSVATAVSPEKSRKSFLQHVSSSPTSSQAQSESSYEERTPPPEDIQDTAFEVRPHHQGLFDALKEVSQQLLLQVEDQEAVFKAVSRSYKDGGDKLLQSVLEQHAREAQESAHQLDSSKAKVKEMIGKGRDALVEGRRRTRVAMADLSGVRKTSEQATNNTLIALKDQIGSIDGILEKIQAR